MGRVASRPTVEYIPPPEALPDEFSAPRLRRRALQVAALLAVVGLIAWLAPGLGEVRERLSGARPAPVRTTARTSASRASSSAAATASTQRRAPVARSPRTRACAAMTGTHATRPIVATARIAGRSVSSTETCGPTPRNIRTPITATATKFAPLLSTKKATEWRAISAPAIPLLRSAHAPSASPAAPLAGTSEPAPSADMPSS